MSSSTTRNCINSKSTESLIQPYIILNHNHGGRTYRESVSVGIPVDNRSSPPPCGQHQALSPRAQRPLCSDPWPSCCRRRSVRTRSCPVERAVRMVPISRSPWSRVQDPVIPLGERTCHLNI